MKLTPLSLFGATTVLSLIALSTSTFADIGYGIGSGFGTDPTLNYTALPDDTAQIIDSHNRAFDSTTQTVVDITVEKMHSNSQALPYHLL